ncbi:MAG TPA: hypothetical protein VN458_00005 [Solirubrobacterales bacterium]|nr:hypothetical protein [Solirubrobacterales bacterium]
MRQRRVSQFIPRPLRVVVVGVMASLVFSAAAMAAAGDPDPTFSGDGKLRTDFGSGASSAQAAVRQRDGKIVAVGEADGNFLVARYKLDGSLDPSFSGDGRVQTNFGASDGANDVVLQGNTIVVVGGTGDQEAHFGAFALARYNPNGSLETSFSGDGKQTTDFGVGCCDQANGVDIQANGRIVAVGTPGAGFALARYDFNGSLDPNFSGDGKQTTSLGGVANGVAIQRDGRIVAVGGGGGDFELARYNPNGLLDPSFSGDGTQTTDFGEFDLARGVALQSGKIVAVGGAGDDFGLARYNIDGSLDSSFSRDGRQTTDFLFGAGDSGSDVAIQANGRIVAVGLASGGATGQDFGLARYDPNGSLDTSFSADGRKRTSFGAFDIANGVALQGDGRIVAVGDGNGEFALARYLGG